PRSLMIGDRVIEHLELVLNRVLLIDENMDLVRCVKRVDEMAFQITGGAGGLSVPRDGVLAARFLVGGEVALVKRLGVMRARDLELDGLAGEPADLVLEVELLLAGREQVVALDQLERARGDEGVLL